jgi:D-cysteine desulfhydrase
MNHRLSLAFLPTPIEELRVLSRTLGGPRILIKRDDLTGLALGGNKTRKLEFLLADALARKATVLVTAGAAQSNHCRQTAAAAAKCGLKCALVLGGEETGTPNGNLLLDGLLGAEVHWTARERRIERMEELAEELRGKGERPYVIPYGGSNGVGALGYYFAMAEALDQLGSMRIRPAVMLVASSSGGTQAGLVAGAKVAGYDGKIIGVSIDKGERGPEPFEEEMAAIANATLAGAGSGERVTPGDFDVAYDYLGAGYGILGDPEREAIRLLARLEGVLLDPVYTARAMGGLIDMIRRGEITSADTVMFWHTGGAPALFAYASELRQAAGSEDPAAP